MEPRLIDLKHDITRGSRISTPLVWYQEEQVTLDLRVSMQNRRIDIPTGATATWRVWLTSDPASFLVDQSGTIETSESGFVSWDLASNESNLPVSDESDPYEFACYLNDSGGNVLSVVLEGELDVRFTPGTGTPVGTSPLRRSGTISIPNGQDFVDVVHAFGGNVPTVVVVSVAVTSGDIPVSGFLQIGSITAAGFTVDLTAAVPNGDYVLHWIAE